MVIGDVVSRLSSMGIEASEEVLQFPFDKVSWYVKNRINSDEIPEGLEYIAIDMVCAEYLQLAKALGQLTELQFETVANSVTMGDTSYTFNDQSPEQKFDMVLDHMLNGHEEDFIRYRRMVW